MSLACGVQLTCGARTARITARRLISVNSSKRSQEVENVSKLTMGGVLSSLIAAPSAMAAQQITTVADSDNRFGVLLLLLVPVLGWVLFNIGSPLLNQLEEQRSKKANLRSIAVGLLTVGLLSAAPSQAAMEVMTIAPRAAEYASIALLLFPAIAWLGIYLVADAPENLGNK